MIRHLVLAICLVKIVNGAMEGFIVGGDQASIFLHPHSAFMNIVCQKTNGREQKWICGASIVNQKILLTAAHCLAYCSASSTIKVLVGSENKDKGVENSAASYLVHEDYNSKTSYADIGLVKLAWRFRLNSKISRVALVQKPPYNERATVAGWGLIDEETFKTSPWLKHINQTLKSRRECIRVIKEVPEGCICASSRRVTDYASSGDSGSALVVRGFIQIGIVSHKVPAYSKNTIVYTEVAHFYNWIKTNMNRLYCWN